MLPQRAPGHCGPVPAGAAGGGCGGSVLPSRVVAAVPHGPSSSPRVCLALWGVPDIRLHTEGVDAIRYHCRTTDGFTQSHLLFVSALGWRIQRRRRLVLPHSTHFALPSISSAVVPIPAGSLGTLMALVTGLPSHSDPDTISLCSRKPWAQQDFSVPMSFTYQHPCAVCRDGPSPRLAEAG